MLICFSFYWCDLHSYCLFKPPIFPPLTILYTHFFFSSHLIFFPLLFSFLLSSLFFSFHLFSNPLFSSFFICSLLLSSLLFSSHLFSSPFFSFPLFLSLTAAANKALESSPPMQAEILKGHGNKCYKVRTAPAPLNKRSALMFSSLLSSPLLLLYAHVT